MSTKTVPRVMVAQIGARRNYLVPITLHRAGMVAAFYTDWYAPKTPLTHAASAVAQVLPFKTIRRAASRQAKEIPLDRVKHFPLFAIWYTWIKKWARQRNALPLAYLMGGQRFCKAIVREHIPKCDVLYAFSSAAKELFEWARRTGVICVVDQEIPPLIIEARLVREQEEAYPQWTTGMSNCEGVEAYTERQREEWELSDAILCPSQFCRRAVIEAGGPPEKICFLPSGVHRSFFAAERRPEPHSGLRVLFVGNTPIRKGLPDLVLALEQLRSHYITGIFVGATTSLTEYAIRRAKKVGSLLGNVTRDQMISLYASADVLVLPTVSDIFPGAVLEALAMGLAVITTPNCGAADIVRDGIDGFIVPIRSPQSIAEKLELLATDSRLLEEMQHNARQRAADFTPEAYEARLTEVLCDLWVRSAG